MDTAEVQEKVKEVICKTITSIPLTDATSRERLNSDVVSKILIWFEGILPGLWEHITVL